MTCRVPLQASLLLVRSNSAFSGTALHFYTGSNVEIGAFFAVKRPLHAQNSPTLFIHTRGNQHGTKRIRNGNETNAKRNGNETNAKRSGNGIKTIVLRIQNRNFILTATVHVRCNYPPMYTANAD